MAKDYMLTENRLSIEGMFESHFGCPIRVLDVVRQGNYYSFGCHKVGPGQRLDRFQVRVRRESVMGKEVAWHFDRIGSTPTEDHSPAQRPVPLTEDPLNWAKYLFGRSDRETIEVTRNDLRLDATELREAGRSRACILAMIWWQSGWAIFRLATGRAGRVLLTLAGLRWLLKFFAN